MFLISASTFLKGLGRLVLGNFSIDQMVIELNEKNKITAQNYRRTQTKHRKARRDKDGQKPERIEMDCIRVNLMFQIYISLYQNVIEKLEISCYMAVILQNERLLLCQFGV